MERRQIRDEIDHFFTSFNSDRATALQLSHLCQPWPPRQVAIRQGGHPDLAHLSSPFVPVDCLLLLRGGRRITEGRLHLCREGWLVFLPRQEGIALQLYDRLRKGQLRMEGISPLDAPR